MSSAGQAREAATTFQGKLVDAQRRKGKGILLIKLVVASVDAALILPSWMLLAFRCLDVRYYRWLLQVV